MSDEADGKTKALSWLDATFREPVYPTGGGRYAPRMLKPLPSLMGLAVGGSIGLWLLFAALARLVEPATHAECAS